MISDRKLSVLKVLINGLKIYINFYFRDAREEKTDSSTLTNILTLGLSSVDNKSILIFKKDAKTCLKLFKGLSQMIEILFSLWKPLNLIKIQSIQELIISKNFDKLSIENI